MLCVEIDGESEFKRNKQSQQHSIFTTLAGSRGSYKARQLELAVVVWFASTLPYLSLLVMCVIVLE